MFNDLLKLYISQENTQMQQLIFSWSNNIKSSSNGRKKFLHASWIYGVSPSWGAEFRFPVALSPRRRPPIRSDIFEYVGFGAPPRAPRGARRARAIDRGRRRGGRMEEEGGGRATWRGGRSIGAPPIGWRRAARSKGTLAGAASEGLASVNSILMSELTVLQSRSVSLSASESENV